MIGPELIGAEKAFKFKKSFDYSADDLTMPPVKAQHIQVNGEDCDLRNPQTVEKFQIKIKDYRDQLNNHQLDQYDGKSTEMWQGGRSELARDELRLQMANDFHTGKHSLTWEAQQIEASRISQIKAAHMQVKDINNGKGIK